VHEQALQFRVIEPTVADERAVPLERGHLERIPPLARGIGVPIEIDDLQREPVSPGYGCEFGEHFLAETAVLAYV
jgi:hypothetical protein